MESKYGKRGPKYIKWRLSIGFALQIQNVPQGRVCHPALGPAPTKILPTTNLLIVNTIEFVPACITGQPLFSHLFRMGRIGVLIIAENPFEFACTEIAIDFFRQNTFLRFASNLPRSPGLFCVHSLLKMTEISKQFYDI